MTLPSTSAATASTAAPDSELASSREGVSGAVEVKSEDVDEDVSEDVSEDPVAPVSPVVPSSSDALVAAGRLAPSAVGKAPLSRVAQLNARVEKDALDGEARLALIADAVQKGDLERTREVYEDFLRVFPDAVSHTTTPRVSPD